MTLCNLRRAGKTSPSSLDLSMASLMTSRALMYRLISKPISKASFMPHFSLFVAKKITQSSPSLYCSAMSWLVNSKAKIDLLLTMLNFVVRIETFES